MRLVRHSWLLLLFFPSPAHSQQSTLPVRVTADVVEVSADFTFTCATGRAVLTQGALTVRADRMTADRKTGEVTATGHVVLTQEARRLKGETLAYNLNAQRGEITRARVFEEGVILRGERITFSPRLLVAHNASFTTCPGAEPHYAVSAETITLTAAETPPGRNPTAGRLTLRHGHLWFHGKKRIALPNYSVSLGRQQQEEVLLPTSGYGHKDGLFTGLNRAFGRPGARVTAELNLRLTTLRGVRGLLEVRRPVRQGAVYLDYARRESVGDTEVEANQVIGSTADVLVNREPEVGERVRERPLGPRFKLTAEVTAGNYSEMDSEADRVLGRAGRIAASAIVADTPHELLPHITVGYALGGSEALYSTGTEQTISYARVTVQYAPTAENRYSLSYVNRASWGESPFHFDTVTIPQELQGEVRYRVNPAWRVRVVERYDLVHERTRDMLVAATRTAHCLEYTLAWRLRGRSLSIGVNLIPAPPGSVTDDP